MKIILTKIQQTEAIIIGEKNKRAILFVHGQGGNKEEALQFAEIAVPLGYQVIGIDLPVMDLPWDVLPRLLAVRDFLKKNYHSISLRANSIGCWYSLLAFENEQIAKALFVSPILDMKAFIECKEQKDMKYYEWVVQHQIERWQNKTYILRPDKDLVVSDRVYEAFISKFACGVTTVADGEHWFHTPEQLRHLSEWEKYALTEI
ncbi:MAG: hypothetical protein ACI4BH_02010 [Muribaculaceae bacterium]